jgi:hypothetical protein
MITESIFPIPVLVSNGFIILFILLRKIFHRAAVIFILWPEVA